MAEQPEIKQEQLIMVSQEPQPTTVAEVPIAPVITTTIVSGRKDNWFLRMVRWLIPSKSKSENAIQYLLRQLYLSDSRGLPSITVTILFFVMGIVAAVTGLEIEMAKRMVETTVTMGTTITKTIKPLGFSDNYLYLVIGLSIVITSWYRIRQKNSGESQCNSPGIVGPQQQGQLVPQPGTIIPPVGIIGAAKEYVGAIVKRIIK